MEESVLTSVKKNSDFFSLKKILIRDIFKKKNFPDPALGVKIDFSSFFLQWQKLCLWLWKSEKKMRVLEVVARFPQRLNVFYFEILWPHRSTHKNIKRHWFQPLRTKKYNFCTRFSLFMHISIFFWKKMSTTIKQTTAQRPRSGASIEAVKWRPNSSRTGAAATSMKCTCSFLYIHTYFVVVYIHISSTHFVV